jgi:DnaJ like chaperone protein
MKLNNPSKIFFLKVILGMFASLYKSIGGVGSKQIEVVKDFLEMELNLNYEDYLLAENIFNEAMKDNKTVESYAIYFTETTGKDREVRLEMAKWLYSMAMADKTLDFLKSKILFNVCKIFGFSEKRHQRLCEFYLPDRLKYYSTLVSSSEDSNDTIKRNYKRLLLNYHPDRLASKELPEIFIQLANIRVREINEAYTQIRIIRCLS